ncbi:hypothetical protein QBC34DRAFT_418128 [Podospora aff. communis PSN243]|uniref:Rhodopsin domain-containing protein n=1 Tax=Podospora aff. communis PSN243 TaxID=3040156 RepID=A0AAV9G0L8_9PEZI|nr:hypothetical protein QBC34DRAFT_418128 [Podospora aff. communis PSN243]
MKLLRLRDELASEFAPGEAIPVFNQRPAAMGLTISFTVLAWLCTLFRLYVRFRIVRSPWWDDLFVMLALMASTSGSVVYLILMNLGMGKHMDALPLERVSEFLRHFYIGSLTYPLALTFIKLALLCQYLLIFDLTSRRRIFCKYLIGFTSLWGIFFTIPTWVPCLPISAMWDVSPDGQRAARCWGFASRNLSQMLGFYITQSVTTMVIDLVIFLLPIHLFFQRGTQTKTRIALLGLFCLGLCVNFCSIARLVYSLTPTLNAMSDLTWNAPTPTGLAALEINLASICAALPVFWPVVKDGWSRIFVTYEVSVTRESGMYIPRRKRKQQEQQAQVVVRRSGSSDMELTMTGETKGEMKEETMITEWDPYVGDTKTGLGDSETVIESPRAAELRKEKKGVAFGLTV